MDDLNASAVIALLGLEPLEPEGGYFARTYTSPDRIPASALPGRYGEEKHMASAIYYLLTRESYSHLHRLPTDEIWHFYRGDPVELHRFTTAGAYRCAVLGPDLTGGQRPQVVAPAGWWFGARVCAGGSWALVGCTLAPEFTARDFSLPTAEEFEALLRAHGGREEVLRDLALGV